MRRRSLIRICLTQTILFLVSPFTTLNDTSINQTYERGDTATLECISTGGPGNVYQWQANGSDVIGENTTILTLPNVTASTGGTYSCVVSNDAGNQSASTYLFVYPYFLKQPVDSVLTSNGSNFNISCVAAAFPKPEYYWGHEDGREIRTDILINMTMFIISRVQFGDEGNYYCNVTSNSNYIVSRSTLVSGTY